MGFEHGLKKNQILSNNEIVDLFKCSNTGGMRRSKKTNTLVLVSDYTKGLYHDKWIDDVMHYTGMGKIGDQDINFMQNRTLNESKTNGVTLVLFEVFKKNEYTFVGEVELCGEPYQEDQNDDDKKLRKVYVFPLKIKENNL